MALRFRRKKEYSGVRRRVLLLLLVFILSFVFFEVVLNLGGEDIVEAESEASLPVVKAEALGMELGQYFGYVNQMEATYIRDGLVPLKDDRSISLIIEKYNAKIDGIHYEIRSMDSSRKIAENDISEYKDEGNAIRMNIKLENLIEVGPEYLLLLTVNADDRPVYYYIRIKYPVEMNEKEYLDFALYFHNTAMSSEYKELALYVEPDGKAPKGLSDIKINSTLNQIAWRGIDVKREGEPVVQFEEINEGYCAITMFYRVSSNTETGNVYYDVEEYFRMRKGPERIFLLDYKRSMDEILDIKNITQDKKQLILGSASEIPGYKTNEMGTIIGFVWNGALYEYDYNSKELVEVFGFRKDNLNDPRTSHNDFDINIIEIDENGNMDFAVYGYMDSGTHEGSSGINLFHYDSVMKEVLEESFLSTTKPYQILRIGFHGNVFRSSDNKLYILKDGNLLIEDLTNKTSSVLASSEENDNIAISDDGMLAAWSIDNREKIKIKNLDNGKEYILSANSGEEVKVLTFMGEDVVYGCLNPQDRIVDESGNETHPMYEINVAQLSNEDTKVVKTYSRPGSFIRNIEKASAYNIVMDMVKIENGTYVNDKGDSIQNTMTEMNATVMTDIMEEDINKIAIKFNGDSFGEDPSIANNKQASIKLLNEDITIELPETNDNHYYVYCGNRIIASGEDILSLVPVAESEEGIIIDNNQTYIWQYGRNIICNALSPLNVSDNNWDKSPVAECLDIILNYEGKNIDVERILETGASPETILANALDNSTVINLSGCNLSQVMGYVSRGYPVYGTTGYNNALLIVGYDTSSLIIYDTQTNRKIRKGIESMSALFEEQGNHFISYVRKY